MKRSMMVGMLVVFTGLMVQGCGGAYGTRSYSYSSQEASSSEVQACLSSRHSYSYSQAQNEEMCFCSIPYAKQYIRGEISPNRYTHAVWDCMEDAGMDVPDSLRYGIPRD